MYYVTAIANPKAPPGTKDAIKSFNYDYSYYSHDVSMTGHFRFPLTLAEYWGLSWDRAVLLM